MKTSFAVRARVSPAFDAKTMTKRLRGRCACGKPAGIWSATQCDECDWHSNLPDAEDYAEAA